MEVNDWIYETYDEETLERIYIHGDGAKWIKTGIKYIPKSKYALDDYHENKAIMIATGAQPGYRKLIKTIIKDANKDEFKKATKELLKTAKSEKEKERIIQFRRYINNNWKGIEIKKKENCGGCCGEGQVSHVLSARLSSRPMGWSKEGLGIMSRLRAYIASGGEIESEHLKKKAIIEKYIEKAMKKTKRAFQGINPDTLENIYSLKMGQLTPIYKALKSLQHSGYILNN